MPSEEVAVWRVEVRVGFDEVRDAFFDGLRLNAFLLGLGQRRVEVAPMREAVTYAGDVARLHGEVLLDQRGPGVVPVDGVDHHR